MARFTALLSIAVPSFLPDGPMLKKRSEEPHLHSTFSEWYDWSLDTTQVERVMSSKGLADKLISMKADPYASPLRDLFHSAAQRRCVPLALPVSALASLTLRLSRNSCITDS